MDPTTIQQLDKLREESRELERQSKALPVFLSITLIPILIICGWVVFPEDSRGIVYLGKVWAAGILIGLMICGYLATSMGLTISFRTYWPSLTCGLAMMLPLIVSTFAQHVYGFPLIQFSVFLGVTACGLGLYYYLTKIGTKNTYSNFTAHFLHSFVAFIVLFSQFEAGIGIAQSNVGRSKSSIILVCACYPFLTALFRRICLLIVPKSGRMASEIISIYFGSITYRILTIFYYNSWDTFVTILILDLVFKWIFYSCQLTDGYLSIKKQVVNGMQRFSCSFPSSVQRFVRLDEGDEEENEEFISLPLEKERDQHHKELSLFFFLHTHADLYFGIGLTVVQLAALKLISHDSTVNCFSDFWADYIAITIKYGVVAVFQVLNLLSFTLFATKVLKKNNFRPVAEGTASLSLHHLRILFTCIALYLLVFILFFHIYGGKSAYCPELQ